jgi:tetratricopeptide (TPR) repeat protein
LKFLLLLLFIFSSTLSAQVERTTGSAALKKIYELFDNGQYLETVDALNELEGKLKNKKSQTAGIIHYWRGLALARTNEFEDAAKSFGRAIKVGYKPKDIYYEMGQALYVAEKLRPAVAAFQNSIKRGYKKAVSLYYIGFLYQQNKRRKKAITYYKMIERLPEEESKDVLQASRTQIGDIYLEQAKRLPDSFVAVEEYVIPQYEKAIEADEDSEMANELRIKVRKLMRDYDLLLFQLRNGKQTAIPRYFLSANILTGYNTNVNADSDTEIEALEGEAGGIFNTLSTFGRYTFYPSSSFSVAPEFSAGYTKYHSTDELITANDSAFYTFGLQMTYEHIYFNRPATFYIDVDYTGNNAPDENGTMAASTTDTLLILSEELRFWKNHISVFRLKYLQSTAEEVANSFTTSSFVYEHISSFGAFTLLHFFSYDMSTYAENEASNNNILTYRIDLLMPTILFLTPSFNYTYAQTSTPNVDGSDPTTLHSIGGALTKQLNRKWYMTFNYGYATNQATLDEDTYTAITTSLAFEYVY